MFTPPKKALVLTLFFLIATVLATVSPSAAQNGTTPNEPLGMKYCGNVEKKYGIIGDASNTPYEVVVRKFYYIKITGVIDQSTEEYVDYAITAAETEGAGLIILLNTPGGYLESATNIVVRINRAKIPVIAFVFGKWAESAGTLILVTSHVAAMQPGTIIGSMQPVLYDPQSGVYKPVNESKIINPIIKILCEHGATKGRNATALVRFVLKNDNYGATEAFKYGVIDVIANNTEDLLYKLEGKVVALPSGSSVALEYDGSPIEEIPPTPRIALVHALSDPILSGILLSLGTLILIFSIISGHLAYATIGALLLLLGLAGTGYSVNMVSLLLIALGALLVAIELHTPGFGIFGGVGIVMLVFGIVLLPTGGGFAIASSYANTILYALYAIGAAGGALTALMVYKLIQVRKRKPIVWSIVGAEGRAIDDIPPNGEGFVIVQGEYWKATSDEEIRKGDRVIVVEKRGPILVVKRVKSGGG
ncbi:MAG: nodulation protein NfeD [Desulfurococcales archaeon]|nr:nodulation protein NfeD [Desulfurococcales archaeon]